MDVVLRVAMVLGVAIVGWFVSRSVLERAPRRGDSAFVRALAADPPAASVRPEELGELERVVRFGRGRAGDLHSRLRPVLRAVAADRLQRAHGVDLDRDSEAARRLLGDSTFGLLRADRPAPTDRWTPGIPRRELADVIERLEAL